MSLRGSDECAAESAAHDSVRRLSDENALKIQALSRVQDIHGVASTLLNAVLNEPELLRPQSSRVQSVDLEVNARNFEIVLKCRGSVHTELLRILTDLDAPSSLPSRARTRFRRLILLSWICDLSISVLDGQRGCEVSFSVLRGVVRETSRKVVDAEHIVSLSVVASQVFYMFPVRREEVRWKDCRTLRRTVLAFASLLCREAVTTSFRAQLYGPGKSDSDIAHVITKANPRTLLEEFFGVSIADQCFAFDIGIPLHDKATMRVTGFASYPMASCAHVSDEVQFCFLNGSYLDQETSWNLHENAIGQRFRQLYSQLCLAVLGASKSGNRNAQKKCEPIFFIEIEFPESSDMDGRRDPGDSRVPEDDMVLQCAWLCFIASYMQISVSNMAAMSIFEESVVALIRAEAEQIRNSIKREIRQHEKEQALSDFFQNTIEVPDPSIALQHGRTKRFQEIKRARREERELLALKGAVGDVRGILETDEHLEASRYDTDAVIAMIRQEKLEKLPRWARDVRTRIKRKAGGATDSSARSKSESEMSSTVVDVMDSPQVPPPRNPEAASHIFFSPELAEKPPRKLMRNIDLREKESTFSVRCSRQQSAPASLKFD